MTIGSASGELDTPVLLVDAERMRANIRRFSQMAQQAGVRLRPHIKTHKTPEIARLQVEAGAGGITAAKLSEAEVFADAGIDDIFVAYPIVGAMKASRAAKLAQKCRLIVGAENVTGIQQLARAAQEQKTTILVRVEVNSGLNRSGALPTDVLMLCRLVQESEGLELDGIFTFRGASFPDAPSQDPEVLGYLEGELMVRLANQLRDQGVPIREISVGSTPTGSAAAQVPGVTEVRPGTYIFFDRMTTLAGVNTTDEIALSILATVVSRPTSDVAIVDAGSKTFCGDIVPAQIGLKGYGITIDGEQGFVSRMSEEHAFVQLAPGFDPAVGEKLLFYPNHVCTTVNLSNELYIMENGLLDTIWVIAARGLRQ